MKKPVPPSLDVLILQSLFQKNRPAVSGVTLAEKWGVTRAAIWKHVEQLQQLGYPIEAQPQLGYRLGEPIPDLVCADEILGRLNLLDRSFPLPWSPLVFKETRSTQDLVSREAQHQAPEGLLVIADQQTGGRGRRGRIWESTPGRSLCFSFLLRPAWPLAEVSRLTILTSLAAAEALEKLTGLRVQIKWPNDLFIRDKKVGGILTEIQSDPERILFSVIGVGLNFHHRASDFSPAVRRLATSLWLETKMAWRRTDYLLLFLHRLEHHYRSDFAAARKAWTDRCLNLGKSLVIETPRGRKTGQAMGLDDQGALLLRNEAGQVEAITAGDII
jgi:BirA family biotin operon repressor/biotin-[acetyl-CoA-carboxylase] ligase